MTKAQHSGNPMAGKADGKADAKPAATGGGRLVWDLPTRAFHWLLVALIIGAYVTGEILDNAMDQHMLIGYAILTLLLFRIAWGFLGGRHARFADFLRAPKVVFAYLASLRGRGEAPAHSPGHNPLGALSVAALLGLLLLQATAGLMADDEILVQGPLADEVPKQVRVLATSVHYWLFAAVLQPLIALHIAAILYYGIAKRERLVGAMLSGRKPWLPAAPAEEAAVRGSLVRAVLLFALAAALVFALDRLAG